MRAALLTWLLAGPAMAQGQGLSEARFTEPTTRYAHGVFGETEEWGALEMVTETGETRLIRLPDSRVFEDTAPRLADVDGDGAMEAVVVETDAAQGARLSVYGPDGLIAATPYIGTSHRWLAPLPPAELDGDGHIELAYVDRPHLARVLRVWRLRDGVLEQVAALEGLTNHRFGAPDISGGVRDCGEGPELVLADASWRRIMAVRLVEGTLSARDIGPLEEAGFALALDCAG
ncbi:VCBS repeat-containing protein [Limimaricola sp. G21655-S1]|uniref:VCBS repeat-containing protein n=1 Tax=Limimaricola sp. G21655-S1 TaxID=3014768 RepID=UPI0022AEA16C|nr:VCBS repeat-containing protein [Limimaricola sp. G21655-S1]MCZ4260413.1 VCBS repeat-containing protein [Limimaricola sp. G21655-S1]